MRIRFTWIYNVAIIQIEFRMQREFITLVFFEIFYLVCLSNPARQYSSHAFHRGLTQLVRFTSVVIYSPENVLSRDLLKTHR